MFAIWQGTVRSETVGEPFTGLAYEEGEIDSLPAVLEFDAASLVLRAFGRVTGGTVRGDMALAERFLNLFFAI